MTKLIANSTNYWKSKKIEPNGSFFCFFFANITPSFMEGVDNNVAINKFAAHVIHTDHCYCTRNKYWGFNSGGLVWRCDRMHIYYCLDY